MIEKDVNEASENAEILTGISKVVGLPKSAVTFILKKAGMLQEKLENAKRAGRTSSTSLVDEQ